MKWFDLQRFSLYHCKDRLDSKTGNVNRKCKDRIIISSVDRILKQTARNMHGPDIPQIEVQQSMARIREAASKTQETPAKFLNKELAKDLPAEFKIKLFPSLFS